MFGSNPDCHSHVARVDTPFPVFQAGGCSDAHAERHRQRHHRIPAAASAKQDVQSGRAPRTGVLVCRAILSTGIKAHGRARGAEAISWLVREDLLVPEPIQLLLLIEMTGKPALGARIDKRRGNDRFGTLVSNFDTVRRDLQTLIGIINAAAARVIVARAASDAARPGHTEA